MEAIIVKIFFYEPTFSANKNVVLVNAKAEKKLPPSQENADSPICMNR